MAIAAPPQFPDITPQHHRPSGKPAWTRVLLSGDEGARKSWTAAELSADPRIDGMYWLEIGAGELTAEEYGAIPGSDYLIIDHDGTYVSIYQQLAVHWHLAKAAEEAGEVWALGVDSMSGERAMLLAFADLKARRREHKKLVTQRKDPSGVWTLEHEVRVDTDVWNFINRKRHDPFMSLLLSWPGPVVYTAREKLATPFDVRGNPIANAEKVWSLDADKSIGHASTAWVRMTRAADPEVIKLRSVNHGIAVIPRTSEAPKDRKPFKWRDGHFTLAELIFDVIGCERGVSRAPEFRELDADQALPGEIPVTGGLTEGPASGRARLAAAVVYVLRALDLEDAGKRMEWAAGRTEAGTDVADLLTATDRETLGVPDDTAITLLGLAEVTYTYCEKHQTGPRVPPAEDQAAA